MKVLGTWFGHRGTRGMVRPIEELVAWFG
jgi:hypothetical protein